VVLMVTSSEKTSEEFVELLIFFNIGFPFDNFLRFCEIPCTWHDKQTTGNASPAVVAAGRHVRR
jgi:hypothetical protein